MAYIETRKSKRGTYRRIRYYFKGRRYHTAWFDPLIDKNYVLALKKEIETNIALDKASIQKWIPQEQIEHTLRLKDFAEWYANIRRKDINDSVANETLERYLIAIRVFARSIGPEKYLAEITTEHLKQFKENEIAAGKHERGINKNMKHLIHPFKLAFLHRLIPEKIDVVYFKVSKRLPDILMPPEIDALFLKMPEGECQLAFNILRNTGVRRGELFRTRRSDYDLVNGVLVIQRGKNYHQRNVPLRDSLIKYLSTNAIFVSRQPDNFLLSISPNTLTKAINKAKHACGIKKRGSAHILRHSIGCWMINNGFSEREIQTLLGHETLEMTKLYSQVSDTRLKNKINATDPGKIGEM